MFSRLFACCFVFPTPRTGHPRHRKRLLRHEVVKRGLPAEAERRTHTPELAANQQRDQRHLPSNQGQGEETGADSFLSAAAVADLIEPHRDTTLPSPTNILLLKMFSKLQVTCICSFQLRGRAAQAFQRLILWCSDLGGIQLLLCA